MQKKSLDQKYHIRVDRGGQIGKLLNKNNLKNFYRRSNFMQSFHHFCSARIEEQFLTVEKWLLLEDHSPDDSEIY